MALLGIIGGSGLYRLEGLTNQRDIELKTPFGEPSSPLITGELNGITVAFIARHGREHSLLPSEVNYRANIWALKMLGAKWCLAVNAVGSLVEEYTPGDMVIPDQIIDRTSGRISTFFGQGLVAHVSFADPFCPVFRTVLIEASRHVSKNSTLNFAVHDGGTFLCMQGPAFSTRAESHMYRAWGAKLIGMTVATEAKLAREAEIAYAALGCVTDYDCWREGSSVEASEILKILKSNASSAEEIIRKVTQKIGDVEPSSMAAYALREALVTPLSRVPQETIENLNLLIEKYKTH